MKICLVSILGLALFLPAAGQTVRFHTNLGDIDVNLLPDSAPLTVENFLKYTDRGSYNNSIFHRSVPGFIIQGGGYKVQSSGVTEIPSDPPVRNEFKLSNARGTLAMAKLGSDPNSATNQWFFNLANNASNLNNQNGGFTVFGRVANDESLAVMDRIAALTVVNAGSPFDQLPLVNYRGGQIQISNFAVVSSITRLEDPVQTMKIDGIVTASNFGGFQTAAPGSFIEIYGSNFGGQAREWAGSDFVNGKAPSSLDDVSVTVDGQPAFISYAGAGQVNAQIPANIATGGQVPVIVKYKDKSSEPFMLSMGTLAAGLLAPAPFKVGDKQYVAAFHGANNTYVSNGSVPDIPAAPAVAGEALTFYGGGFGPVIPAGTPIAGEAAQGETSLTNEVQFYFGEASGTMKYAGLSPGLIGVYQFNVMVPADTPHGDVPLKVTVAGQPIGQTLFIPVQ
jgi:uncharacterized protein (TIGR03437 family)